MCFVQRGDTNKKAHSTIQEQNRANENPIKHQHKVFSNTNKHLLVVIAGILLEGILPQLTFTFFLIKMFEP